MNAVDVSHVSKAFLDKVAVSDLSFSVARGEVLGLIGPNGAGKTTTIRMLMDIFKPDSGEVRVLGEPPSESTKNHVGYLPEERGLYRKLRAIDCVVYLATLKGMDRRAAEKRAAQLLDQTGMLAASTKKVEELSHGMAQLVQFVVTIVHDPDLVVLDEPFQALDPVNADLLRRMVLDRKTSPQDVLRRLVALGVRVDRVEVATPSLNEIFLQVVGERRGAGQNGGVSNGGVSRV